MKQLLITGLAVVVCLISCSKKESGTTPETQPPVDTPAKSTKIYTATELTAASVAYHGSIIKGDLPGASTDADAPVLAADMATATYVAIANRYIIIPLLLTKGTAAGVNAKFEGADAYFSVDFSKPLQARVTEPVNAFSRDERQADSLLMIRIPENISNSEFKLLVAVKDAAGNVSNTVNLKVTLFNTKYDTTIRALSGRWYNSRYRASDLLQWSSSYAPVVSNTEVRCVDNKLIRGWVAGVEPYEILNNRYVLNNEYMQFDTDGSGVSEMSDSTYILSINNSTCDKPFYNVQKRVKKSYFGWYYHTVTKRFYRVDEVINGAYPTDITVFVVNATLENGNLIFTDEKGWQTEYVRLEPTH
ncbi:hypothetical protein SAMN05444266_106103 [Chitinophaga jiangningensis]|uniref:DUF1735 domain-containing protein n=1 Tax=Chitinophaga jiangningensis TaxID=1419482 RepID=A0A1M7FDR9_9BACT|nr:hypothetical protein [Chitinophaga jiangningensis]SHM02201.1 hypothetical protein SAMN05444266_106103 [Chitinophaga jiangningensis]